MKRFFTTPTDTSILVKKTIRALNVNTDPLHFNVHFAFESHQVHSSMSFGSVRFSGTVSDASRSGFHFDAGRNCQRNRPKVQRQSRFVIPPHTLTRSRFCASKPTGWNIFLTRGKKKSGRLLKSSRNERMGVFRCKKRNQEKNSSSGASDEENVRFASRLARRISSRSWSLFKPDETDGDCISPWDTSR